MDVRPLGKQTVKKKNDLIRIENRLDKFERVNSEELKALTNGEVNGLIPVSVEVKRKRFRLSVELANQMTLKDYCSEAMDTNTILSLIVHTADIASSCERRGLRPDSLCWDEDLVFVDRRDGGIRMLYWPVVRLERSSRSMLQFYSNFLTYMYRDKIDAEVTKTYASFFYQRDSMALYSFQTMIHQAQKNWEQRQTDKTPDMENWQHAADYSYNWENKGDAWLESVADSRKIWLNRNQVVIGRSKETCDVVIQADASISRCHVCIKRCGDEYMAEDLGSKNGTYVGRKRLTPKKPIRLKNGDQIRLGDSFFIFHRLIPQNTVSIYQLTGEKR